MNALFLVALLLQSVDSAPAIKSSADAQRREAQLRQVASLANSPPPSIAEANTKRFAVARDEEFVGKFNKLVSSLMDFSDAYKEGKSLDIKKAQAVRKAWLELEKSEPIFQEGKKK